MTNPSSPAKTLGLKALVAALMLAAGLWYGLGLSRPPEAQTRNEGCVPGNLVLIPSGMALAHFVDTRTVGCGPVPSMAVGWAQVFQAGFR